MSELVLANKTGLTAAQFEQLADVPPEIEWLANITNAKTRRAYKNDVAEFFAFAGLKGSAEVWTVTRAHVIARRKDLEHAIDRIAEHGVTANPRLHRNRAQHWDNPQCAEKAVTHASAIRLLGPRAGAEHEAPAVVGIERAKHLVELLPIEVVKIGKIALRKQGGHSQKRPPAAPDCGRAAV